MKLQESNEEAPSATTSGARFENLGIAPKLLEILSQHKFVTPTPIQEKSIPAALTGTDLMGIAQTGTGKTLAFGIPMIQRLAQSGGKGTGLVVLPTRELALQVNETLKKIGTPIGLKTAILIGGEAIGRQHTALKRSPHIIIATPGRLIDHLDHKTVDLSKTEVLVLDEADRMLDMGFAPQINKILEKVPKGRQTLLFSATMPAAIVKIANTYMRTPLRIEVAPAGSAVSSVTQEIYFLERGQKLPLLSTIVKQYTGSILIFSRTKYGAKKIARDVRAMNVTATEIHSNRSLNQRLEALKGFKLGNYRVLVATDIAARGIDVTGIQLVINYDLPDQAEDYVHRIGRTGRASMTGHAISFATHDQRRDVNMIERLIQKQLPVAKLPESLPHIARTAEPEREERGRGRRESSGRSTNSRPGGRVSSGRTNSRIPESRTGNRSNTGRASSSGFKPSTGYKPRPSSGYVPRTSSAATPTSGGYKPSYKASGYVPRAAGGTTSSSSRPPSKYTPRAAGSSAGRPGAASKGRKRWSDYERGRKPAPASLKKISPNASGFYITRKVNPEDE
ncbi:MAG TPA: DEAD/DEAH box helicase [Patescibacteria group bacterium]|jgi:ATP-dependent RNA helicase RhlE|nr:DEAD/DEAH box helicase [Patescibacteria group bacterium]